MIDLYKDVYIQKSLRDNHNIYILPRINIHGWYYEVKYDNKETNDLITCFTQYSNNTSNCDYYKTFEEALSNGNLYASRLLDNKKKSQYELLLELAEELSLEHKNKDKILFCFKKCGILDDNSEFTDEFKNLKKYENINK